MVAYSFKAQFAEPIATLKKRQTVRSDRRRHARPGEPVQLYTAMRTKHCRKILSPDPICLDVRHILIGFDSRSPNFINSIEIDAVSMCADEMEAFAVADGFAGALADGFALRRMGEFWLRKYDWNRWSGVVIRWEPS